MTLLDRVHEVTGLKQRVVSPRVQPGKTASEHFYIEGVPLEVGAVNVGDFQLATLGRLNALGDLDNIVVVEVQAGHCIVGFWFQRFFFNT
ncbi:hypothetical protein D3C84_1100580 [compost metagenome]